MELVWLIPLLFLLALLLVGAFPFVWGMIGASLQALYEDPDTLEEAVAINNRRRLALIAALDRVITLFPQNGDDSLGAPSISDEALNACLADLGPGSYRSSDTVAALSLLRGYWSIRNILEACLKRERDVDGFLYWDAVPVLLAELRTRLSERLEVADLGETVMNAKKLVYGTVSPRHRRRVEPVPGTYWPRLVAYLRATMPYEEALLITPERAREIALESAKRSPVMIDMKKIIRDKIRVFRWSKHTYRVSLPVALYDHEESYTIDGYTSEVTFRMYGPQ